MRESEPGPQHGPPQDGPGFSKASDHSPLDVHGTHQAQSVATQTTQTAEIYHPYDWSITTNTEPNTPSSAITLSPDFSDIDGVLYLRRPHTPNAPVDRCLKISPPSRYLWEFQQHVIEVMEELTNAQATPNSTPTLTPDASFEDLIDVDSPSHAMPHTNKEHTVDQARDYPMDLDEEC